MLMYAMRQASDQVTSCLDWNNNYGDAEKQVHPLPLRPRSTKYDDRQRRSCRSFDSSARLGPPVAAMAAMWAVSGPRLSLTAGLLTKAGRINVYLGEGAFTSDPIPQDFFRMRRRGGYIQSAKTSFRTIGETGHRHHVAVTPGEHAAPLREALEKYLGFDVTPVG